MTIMKTMSRFALTFLLAMVLCLGLSSVGAFAGESDGLVDQQNTTQTSDSDPPDDSPDITDTLDVTDTPDKDGETAGDNGQNNQSNTSGDLTDPPKDNEDGSVNNPPLEPTPEPPTTPPQQSNGTDETDQPQTLPKEPDTNQENTILENNAAASDNGIVPDTPSAAVQEFLAVTAQLPERVTWANFEEVSSLMEACHDAYDALNAGDYAREDVSAGIQRMAALMEGMQTLAESGTSASIGEVGYATFKEAMQAAKDGETVKLQENVNSDGMYMASSDTDLVSIATQIANNITVNLNGYTIKATGAATNYDRNNNTYGVFRVSGDGYSLTLDNSADTVGKIDGKVINGPGSTLNINGTVEIAGFYENGKKVHITSYGNININASLKTLTIKENDGVITVGENGSVDNLTVNMPSATGTNNYTPELVVNGPVKTLTVTQTTPHPVSQKNASNINILRVNAPVDTLKLTQTVATMNPSKEGSSNIAYINAPVETLTVTQTGKASQLYMNSEIGTLDLSQSQAGGSSKADDIPTAQAGEGFHVGTLNANINRVNFANQTNYDKYRNPTIEVPDIVLIEGMDGHQITAGQMDSSTWKASNGTAKFEYEGIDYKYLTTVCVFDGKISLHKTVLKGNVAGAVYLDGVNGNDSNDGKSPTTAFKTFTAAKEAVGEGNLATIIVVNTVTVSDEEKWDLGVTIQDEVTGATNVNGILKRFEQFTGTIINVASGGKLTLANIILDGGKEEGRTAVAPLITVQEGGVLTIENGTTLRNNVNTGRVRGGAINNKGDLVINGGLIQNNSTVESGGGIYSTGTLTMKGGEISYNKATAFTWAGAPEIRTRSTGGGICIGSKGTMTMTGGLIAYNSLMDKYSNGGGIALGDTSAGTGMKLTMTGGKIIGNRCTALGGGIAVWTGGEAVFSGGEILNNTALVNANVLDLNYFGNFGGGGIYINKGATATMTNVVVTKNNGTGLSICPTGDTRFYIKNGGVFYGSGSNIYASSSTGVIGKVPLSITNYTLNGYKYNWKDAAGNLLDAEALNQVLLNKAGHITLISGLTDEQGKSAAQYCNLLISGNSLEQGTGAGIGCNGTLIIGEDSDVLSLEKKVDGDATNPDTEFKFMISFKTSDGNAYTGESVKILRDGKEESVQLSDGMLELTLAKDGYVVFPDLPVGVTYTITEGESQANKVTIDRTTVTNLDKLDNYQDPDIKHDTEESNEITADVVDGIDEVVFTNTYDTGSLTIKKLVNGTVDPEKVYTFYVTDVNGKQIAEVTLKAGEEATVNGLNPGEYTVSEADASIGDYSWKVNGTGTVVVTANGNTPVDVTNIYEILRGKLTVSKVVIGAPTSEADKTYTFTVKDAAGSTVATVLLKNGESQIVENLLPGTYTVTEDTEGAAINGYTLDVTGNGGIAALTPDGSAQVTITNTYKLIVGQLSVNKVVSGAPASEADKTYTFTVKNSAGDTVATVELKDGETKVIENLVPDTYTVTEDTEGAAIDGYTLVVTGDGTLVALTPDEAQRVTITNTYTPVTPPPTPDRPRPDRPTTPEEPPVDIPDPDVPLTPAPEEPPVIIEEPDVPLAEQPPEVDIPEVDVPLVSTPPATTIPDPDVPLADVPQTGDASVVWSLLAASAVFGLAVLNGRRKEEV